MSAAAPLLWVNGERVQDGAPAISPLDRGLLRADGVFETMRSHEGRVFRLAEHLARMERGAGALGIPVPAALSESISTAAADAKKDGIADAAIRLTLTRGPDPGFGLGPSARVTPTTVLMLVPLATVLGSGPNAQGFQSPPASAHVASGRRNELAPSSGHKTLAYADAILAAAEARAAGADDALLLDTAGHVSEAATANLFIVSDDELVTPPTACGALLGITRGAVLEIAKRLGLGVTERALELDELLLAREAFFTSSLRGIVPLVKVGGHRIGEGSTGPMTESVIAQYEALVRKECGR